MNRLDYLKATISSCQNHISDIEIIVSANGSGQDTISWLKENCQVMKFSYITHSAILDPFVHWNKLIKEASGDFVVILSDDDLFTETLLESLVLDANKYSNASMLMYGHDTIDQFGNLISKFRSIEQGLLESQEAFQSLMDGVNHRLCAIAFNRSTLNEIGGFPEHFKITAGDCDVIQKMSLLGSVYFSNNPLAVGKYRVWEGSDTSTKFLEQQWHDEIQKWTESILAFSRKMGSQGKPGWPASIRVDNYRMACINGCKNGKHSDVQRFSKTIPKIHGLNFHGLLTMTVLRNFWLFKLTLRRKKIRIWANQTLHSLRHQF